MYKSISLPLDGSAMAEQALAYAVAQAEHFQAELILMKNYRTGRKEHKLATRRDL